MKIVYQIIVLILIFIYGCTNETKNNHHDKKFKKTEISLPKYEILDMVLYNVLDSFIIFASQNPDFNNSILTSIDIDKNNNEIYFEVTGIYIDNNSEGYLEYKGYYFIIDAYNISDWIRKTNTKKSFIKIEINNFSDIPDLDDAMTICIYEYKNGKFYSTFKQLGDNGSMRW